MTVPPTPAAGKQPDGPSPQRRPAGPTGGHTVQDHEQPVARMGQPAQLERSAPVGQASRLEEDADAPNPPTVPRYLRSNRRAGGRPAADAGKPAFDARTATLTAQSAALVDALTRGVADTLALALRPVVASAVDQLIPMILSLGSIPDDADPVQAAVEDVDEAA